MTPAARKQYAAFCASLAKQLPNVHDFIVGNEPNLNRFWWPQFGPKGIDVAARDYERLLAQSYDALKAVDPKVDVIGGAVSPHGQDDPTARRKTHSPTTFIPDLGRYYRASGRTLPIMDAFDFHPYPDNSRTPPDLAHPLNSTVSLADYTKLVSLLGKAFDGTAQLGSTPAGVLRRVRRPVDRSRAARTPPTRTSSRRPPATPSPRRSRPTTTAGRSTSRTASRP